jgi:hypothetical protein
MVLIWRGASTPSTMRTCLFLSSVLVCVYSQACNEGSQCTQGIALNITNATGACVHNPFFPDTKVCGVCSDCHKQYPGCPCCNPVYDSASSCANCFVDDPYALAKCGNHAVSYTCDKTEELDPCVATPGKSGTCRRRSQLYQFVKRNARPRQASSV